MWPAGHRRKASPKGMRYPRDLTDDGRLVEPINPPTRNCGRTRNIDVREVPNSISYVLAMDCRPAQALDLGADIRIDQSQQKATAGVRTLGQDDKAMCAGTPQSLLLLPITR